MYCENCGSKIEERSKFCQNCGSEINFSYKETISLDQKKQLSINSRDIFYSKEWIRKQFFAIVSIPYFDVIADKQNLTLIRLPSYSGKTLGLIIGLIVLNIAGAVIGLLIGDNYDTKKRNQYRLAWIDENKNIISHEYEKDVYIKIPLKQIRTAVVFKANKLYVEFENKRLVLYKNEFEVEQLKKFISDHVL